MNGPVWLQVASVAAVTFALIMLVILLWRRYLERMLPPPGIEVHVTPYVRRPYLLTPVEQRFYHRLYEAVGQEFMICPKVRLADVIEVRGDAIEWKHSWNRIAAKHLDFVLCTADTYQPLLAIELEIDAAAAEGPVHDEWLLRALHAAGMPVLRVKVRRDYDPNLIRKQVEQRLQA